MSLQVHEDTLGYHSRLGYYGEIYLTVAGQPERHVGYMSTWRISRLSGERPDGSPEWAREWLQPLVDDNDDDLRSALSSVLSGPDGVPGEQVRDFNRPVYDLLSDARSDIVFIPMIWICQTVRLPLPHFGYRYFTE